MLNHPYPASRIPLAFCEEWNRLLETKLTPDMPVGTDQVQDDDPNPYRHDERLDYCYVGHGAVQTHIAKLVCRSDENEYRLSLEVWDFDPDSDSLKPRDLVLFLALLDKRPAEGKPLVVETFNFNFHISLSKKVA